MIAKLLVACIITLAAVSSLVVAAREGRFTAGSPFTGVFAAVDPEKPHDCKDMPPEHVIGFTPTDVHIFQRPAWWHGVGVRHRAVWFLLDRPALMIRAETQRGEAIELIVERKGDGFELVAEEIMLANGDRITRSRRADRPSFLPCPHGIITPWATPS